MSPPTVSAWIRCHVDPDRVHRMIRDLAPHFDEVLIIADEALNAGALDLIAAAGPSRILRIPRVLPADRATAWCWEQASTEWALRLDGDELPSTELLQRLRELIRRPATVAWELPRRWLWPDLGHVLAERPWDLEYKPRLMRVRPRHWCAPPVIHDEEHVSGPTLLADLPILHADLVITDRAARAAKAARYDGVTELPSIGGLPFNEAYYLPEQRDRPPSILPIAASDEQRLVEAFAGPDVRRSAWLRARRTLRALAPRLLAPMPLAADERAIDAEAVRDPVPWTDSPAECDRGPLTLTATRARLRVVDPDLRFTVDAGRVLHVALEHRGDEAWHVDGRQPVVLSYRWYDLEGRIVVPEGLRSRLPGPLGPGETTVVRLSVSAPPAGRYLLEIDALVDGVRWFGCPLRVPVTVA